MTAGYGSHLNFPDLTCEELFDACGAYKSNNETEARAIEATLHSLSDIFTQKEKETDDIAIFSDAKSVLEAFENENSKDQMIRKLSLGNVIADHNINITLQWIPGHINIQGNESADTLAKHGARCPQLNNTATIFKHCLTDNQTI